MIIKNICTRILSDGTKINIPVFYFPGTDSKAKSTYIQSCVHGSEVQGYLIALNIIEFLTKNPPIGNVTVVPIANPYGMNNKMGEYTFGRFDPVTGTNWNRNYRDLSALAEQCISKHKDTSFSDLSQIFKKELKLAIDQELSKPLAYHDKLALQLQSLSTTCDIVLDLHCDTISIPHIYCPSYAIHSAIDLGISHIIEIPHEFADAMDEASFCPWVKFTEIYNSLFSTEQRVPIEAFTLELGNHENISLNDAREQTLGILNYLQRKKVIANIELDYQDKSVYSCALENFKTIFSENSGLIIDKAELGNKIEKDKPLLYLSDPSMFNEYKSDTSFIEQSIKEVYCSDDCIPITQISSPIVHEGMALMKVMTNYKKIF